MKIPFDRVAGIYDTTRGLPQEVMRKIVQAFVKELKGYRTVLDIGVGTGRFAKPLQENGFKVVGIDISRSMMQNARKKGVKNLLLGDACSLPFRDYSFDAALSVHVLHLVIEWRTAIKEISRVTKDGLLSVTHVHPSPVSKAYEELAREKGYDTRRIGLGEHELKEIIKPTKSIPAASLISSTDERLTNLRQRAYSRQWKIPEDVDRQIVQELVRRFAGKKYPLEMYILRWNIKDLKSYLKSQTQH
jgi:ubiquinone/menaquinone biosynthesis C-methylase UbiE